MPAFRPGAAAAAHARFVVRRPRRALAAAVAVALLGAVAARDVRLDNNFAALFATSSAEARFREEYRATFGPDDGLLAAVLTVEAAGDDVASDVASDMDPAAIDALVDVVAAVTDAVAEVPGIARVNSPTATEVIAPGTGQPSPAFGPDATLGALPAGERVALARASGLGAQFLVAEDGLTMLVVGELDADLDSYEEVVGPSERFRAAVDEQLVARDGGPAMEADVRAHHAGVTFTRVAAIEQMQSDLLLLAPVATLVMAALLWLFFRRWLAVLAPLVAIGLSLVAT